MAGLIAAMDTADGNSEADVINLATDGTYTLTAVDNTTNGDNGLPLLNGDSALLTINGNDAVIRRDPAGPDMRLLRVGPNASLTLNDLRLENGQSTESGGAILSSGALTLAGCSLGANSAAVAGGAVAVGTGSLTATDTLFENNEAGQNGGAVFISGGTVGTMGRVRLHANFAAQNGGAVANAGTLVLRDSLVDANTSGSLNGSGIFTQSDLEVTGSTISGNISGGPAGGIAAANGAVRIDQSTITGNQATTAGGVFINPTPGTSLRLRNSLVAGNGGMQVSGTQGPGSSNNLIAVTSEIGALRDNGGPLPTHALLPNNTGAIDQGNNALAPPGGFDMRGFARISNGQVDIGAVEFQQPLQVTANGSGQSALLLSPFADPLQLTATESNGIPIVGMEIAFSAPAAGASATFPGGASVVTDVAGSVQALVVANDVAGSYQVSADSVGSGLSASSSFDLSNLGSDLSITLDNGVTSAIPGQSVNYTLVVSNPGPAAVNGVTVSDVFPAALDCSWTSVAAGGASGNGAGSGDLNETLSLPAGGSVTYTIPCDIDSAATGTLVNTATLSAGGDENPANNSSTDTDTLDVTADLSITKTNGATASTSGTDTVYTIVASNAGPSDAPGSVVSDNFPAACIGVTWSCAGAGGGSCTANGAGDISDTVNLPAGDSVTYSATCPIDPAAQGTLDNTATVSVAAGVTDPNGANNSASDSDTLGTSADVSITKEAVGVPASLVVGSTFSYTLTATNVGPSNATTVAVTDTLPATLDLVSNDCGAAYADPVLTWTIGTLEPNTNAVCTLEVEVATPGEISNTASVSSSIDDPDDSNNAATSTLAGAEEADMEISLTSNAMGNLAIGSNLMYTVTGTNNGPGTALEIDFTLELSGNVGFVSSTCGAVLNGTTLTWTVPTLASDAATDCEVTVEVAQPGTIQATANLASLSFDPDPSNNSTSRVVGTAAVPIPTIGNLGLLLLSLLLGGFGIAVLRR